MPESNKFGLNMMDAATGLVSGIIQTGINSMFAGNLSAADARRNYMYGEMAADAADARQRAQWADMYSISAQMRELKKAGLSPSLMYGGNPSQGGAGAAQGTGASGIQTAFSPISLLEQAQAMKAMAEIGKVKAETDNIEKDTDIKKLDEQRKALENGEYKNEWEILNSTWIIDGKQYSIYEAAQEHYTYESFVKSLRDESKTDPSIIQAISTETGQKTLRAIFIAANQFNRDIAVLSSEEMNAHFQFRLAEALNNSEFAKLNAQEAVQSLRTSIAQNELTEQQKNAWNNLLNRLGKKDSTMRDIVIVLGMIINNAAAHYNLPHMNFNKSQTTSTNTNYNHNM